MIWKIIDQFSRYFVGALFIFSGLIKLNDPVGTEIKLEEYFSKCIENLESVSGRSLLYGIGELLDTKMKKFVKTKMLSEVLKLLNIYKEFPII